MTEEEILRALEGKFFRGPSSFYQNPTGVRDEPDVDVEERDHVIEKVRAERAKRALEFSQRGDEQIEREVELSPVKWRIPIPVCIDSVCAAHAVSKKELMKHQFEGSKSPRLVAARQHAAWLIRNLRKETTFQKIATALEYRDHTTVMYSVKKFESVKSKYIPEIAASLEYIREKTGDKTICLL